MINTLVLPYLVDKTISLSTRRPSGLYKGLENCKHLKIETRLIDERFTSVMGECVI